MKKHKIVAYRYPVIAGIFLIVYIYFSLGGKQISATGSDCERPVLRRFTSNLHPDDKKSRKTELFCVTMNYVKDVY